MTQDFNHQHPDVSRGKGETETMLKKPKNANQWQIPVVLFLFVFLSVLTLSPPELAHAQSSIDLSVFQKQGESEAQQARDRSECHQMATWESADRSGQANQPTDPPAQLPPRTNKEYKEQKAEKKVEDWKQRTRYTETLRKCLEGRGYKVVEH